MEERTQRKSLFMKTSSKEGLLAWLFMRNRPEAEETFE